jgi:hypothetical protein
MHHINPKDLFAKADKRIEMFYFKRFKPKVSEERGAFQFQKNPSKSLDLKVKVGSGKYIGVQNAITAFVWDEPRPEEHDIGVPVSNGILV